MKTLLFLKEVRKVLVPVWGGQPEQTEGVDLFFTFTLSSGQEEKTVYIFLMKDGIVKSVTKAEYENRLALFYSPPQPVPEAPNLGSNAHEATEVPPVNP